MTLIELMVSVAVLALVVLIAGRLMTSARDAVQLAQEGITANTDHMAIAKCIRSDIAMLTGDGYLAIVSGDQKGGGDPNAGPINGNWPGTHALVFTSVGSFASRYPQADPNINISANAARIDYGIAKACRTDTDAAPTILFRRAILLIDPNDPNGFSRPYDYESIPLSYQSTWTRSALAGCLTDSFEYPQGVRSYPGMIIPPGGADGTDASPLPIYVPAIKIDHINALWPYLAGNCIAFTVEWTDGTLSGNLLQWYSVANPKDASWDDASRDPNYQTTHAEYPEFKLGDNYCALWTGADKAHWPKALRIQYQLISSRHVYEVIVDLPQP